MRGINTTKVLAWAILLTATTGQMTSALAQRFNIFQTNSTWRYEYRNPYVCLDGVNWQASAYDDSGWQEAIGGFTGNETAGGALVGVTTTTLPAPPDVGGQRASFRKHFNLTNVSGLSLILSNRIDDNAVFWINGQEVARFMAGNPGDPVTCGTFGGSGGEATVWQVITVTAAQLAGILLVGDNVIAVSAGQNGAGSSDLVFAMQLWGEFAFPVMITDSSGLTNRTVETCRNATLTVVATGSEPVSYQWFKGGVAIDPSLNPTATNSSLTLSNVTLLDTGSYTVQVSNPLGSVTSSPATMVDVVPDTTPPTVTRVVAESDLITFTVTFSEPMDPLSVNDFFAYQIRAADNSGNLTLDQTITVLNSSQIVLTTSTTPRDPTKSYNLIVNDGGTATISEACNTANTIAPDTIAPIATAFLVQDAELHSMGSADTPLGGNPTLTVDNDDTGIAQALLRFDNVFGNGPGQVPLGSVISNATLTLHVIDAGGLVNMHQMLIPWDQATVTWNSMVDGVQANDVEASMAIAAAITSPATTPNNVSIDVTASVQAWANGAPNLGWALLPTSGDGFDFNTSENMADRPQLQITFGTQACSPLSIVTQPSASTTINEGQPFSLSVTVNSPGCAATFQWTKGGINIPGATNSVYSVTNAVPSDAGAYQVNVANAAPSSAMSSMANVTVNADTTRPTLLTAVGSTNPATINLTFSEAISAATGGGTTNYSIVPLGGGAALAINSATVSGSNIVLNTGPRVSGTSYQLTITGLRDTSFAGNLIDPNPTVVSLQQDVVIFSWSSPWSYFTNTCLDGQTWQAPGYDASAWLTGPGLFGLDPDGNGTNVTAQLGLSIMTPLEVGTNRLGYYFRKSFDWGFGTAGVQFLLHHFIDDGAAVFVNGSLSVLINQTNPPPLSCTNLSTGGSGEVALGQTNLTGVVSGNNLIAVQVFQSSATSSDVVFGAELIARVTQFGAQGPRLTITIEPSGTQARIQWNPVQGTLQFKNNLDDPAWTDVSGGASGNVVVAVDQLRRFYTLRQ
jgi:hypothetical protein